MACSVRCSLHGVSGGQVHPCACPRSARLLTCRSCVGAFEGSRYETRQGFFWSVPRLTLTGVGLWPFLLDQLQHVATSLKIPLDELPGLCYDLEVTKPLAIAGFAQMLRYFLSHMLEDPRSLTSYSLHGATWATMAGLPEAEKLALGN